MARHGDPARQYGWSEVVPITLHTRFPNRTIDINLAENTTIHCLAGSPCPAIVGRLKDRGARRTRKTMCDRKLVPITLHTRYPNRTIDINLVENTTIHCLAGSPCPAIVGRLKDGKARRPRKTIWMVRS